MSAVGHRAQPTTAVAVFVFVVAANLLFLSLIAHLEPIADDGWGILYRIEKQTNNRPGPSFLINDVVWRYNNRNPRIGEVFTNLNFWPYPIHEILTPSMIMLLFISVFVLALGRLPRPTSLYDSLLLVVVTALCWLAIPDVGAAYFSRPIAGNYTMGACLQLLFFVPLRLWVDFSKKPLLNLSFTVFMFFGGVIAGMANEHTGPTAIVAFAVMAWHTARKLDCRLPTWAASGWCGLVSGYLALFFAPGQTKRYQGLASKTTLTENILARGWAGNLEIIGDLMVMLLPLLVAVTLMAYSYVIHNHRGTNGLESGDSRRRFLEIGFIAICAFGIVGTTLASPMIKNRLFIAPMVLLIIAAVIFTDIVSRPRSLAGFFVALAIVVNLVCFARVNVVYRTVSRESEERIEILRNAAPRSVVRVPFLSHKNRSRIFIGDDFRRKAPRVGAARYFGLERIETYPRPSSISDSS